MSSLYTYTVQARTDPGKVRENNEDAFGAMPDWRKKLGLSDEILQQRGHLFAVADGMGGHAAGEVASQLAIQTLFNRYYHGEWAGPKETLLAAIAAANQAIFEKAEANSAMHGMGTTLVVALYHPQHSLIANVGDSRAYLYRSGKITQITRDHSWVAEQVHSGVITEKEARHHPLRNVITRSLGNEPQITPDIFDLPPLPGDTLLLCSDGLSNLVQDKEMAGILRSYPLDEAADRLLELALERGAPDNVTLVLIQLQNAPQRRSHSVLPWLALITTLIILAGFVWRTLAPAGPKATPAPLAALATHTAPPPPATPSPATPVIAAAEMGVTAFHPRGAQNDEVIGDSIPADTTGLVYVQGPAQLDGQTITIQHISRAGEPHRYVAKLPPDAALKTPVQAGLVGVLGHPQPPEEAATTVLQPLLVLAPFRGSQQLALLWPDPTTSLQQPIEIITVYGAGGGSALGITTPPGAEGEVTPPLRGRWQLGAERTIRFEPTP